MLEQIHFSGVARLEIRPHGTETMFVLVRKWVLVDAHASHLLGTSTDRQPEWGDVDDLVFPTS